MSDILIYTTSNCPNCMALKLLLTKKSINYIEVNMATPEALTELRINGVFTMSAPVLKIGDRFYTYRDLTKDDAIDAQKIERLL